MGTNNPRNVAKFDPRAQMAQFMWRVISHCHILNIKAVGPVVSEIFLVFSIKTYMLPWQPEFQSDLPKNNMKPFLIPPSDAVCVT